MVGFVDFNFPGNDDDSQQPKVKLVGGDEIKAAHMPRVGMKQTESIGSELLDFPRSSFRAQCL